MKEGNFKDFDDEERQLVLDFERTVLQGQTQFFDVDELMIIIDYYLETEDMKPLEKAVRYAEELYPDSTEVRLRRGHLLVAQDKFKPALKIFNQLKRDEPDNTDIDYALGVTYSALGESDKAIECYQRAGQDGWMLGRVYANIAEEYFNQKDYAEAIRYYQLALDTDSYDDATLYNYVDTAVRSDQVDEAIKYLRSFIDEHPYCAAGWHSLGKAYTAKQELGQATDAFEYALAIDKGLLEAYADLSDAMEDLGHISEAVSALRRLAEQTENKASVYVRIAEVYGRENNTPAAIDYLRRALSLEPDNVAALANMALCYVMDDDPGTALPYIKKALKLSGKDPNVLFAAANIYELIDNPEAAYDFYERMFESDQCAEAQCHGFVGFLYRQEWYDELIGFAEESLALFPHDWFYSTYLAAAYFHTNRYNSARRVLPDVEPILLKEICPKLVEHRLLGALVPPEDDSSTFGQFMKNINNTKNKPSQE